MVSSKYQSRCFSAVIITGGFVLLTISLLFGHFVFWISDQPGMHVFPALSLALATPSYATILYASSYAGTITTLNLTLPSGNASTAIFDTISTSTGCSPNPTWLALDYSKSLLYCLDEGLSGPNGTISSYSTSDEGALVQLDKIDVILGPVSSAFYGEGKSGLALAHYSGSSFSTLSNADPTALTVTQSATFNLSQSGPDPSRQDAPHPHEAVLDPTGDYLIVPDLGADLVRVFRVVEGGLAWTMVEPLTAAPGSGPRHVSFLVAGEKTFMYLVSELANTITGYEVVYNDNSTLSFVDLFAVNTHGNGKTVPKGTTAAEIAISPDKNFLIVSSRGENSLTIPNFDSSNSTEIVSDAIISYSINQETGGLDLVQAFPSGGRVPRHFSINKAGNLVAVGLQSDSRVVVIERDVKTGFLKRFIANATVAGEVTAVIFNE